MLGMPFRAREVSTQLDDSTFALRPGIFGGAESIRVHVQPDGRVYALSFSYDGAQPYENMVAEYTESLGAPNASGGVETDSAWTGWQDTRTRFEITRTVRAGRNQFRSRLSDYP